MNPTTVESTFDEASEAFEALTPLLWGPIGAATARAAGIAPGERVLDACCGTGASALPAAVATGPDGQVHGVDLAERLLERARERAAAEHLAQASFHHGDVLRWRESGLAPAEGYDVVQCALGVFFLPDMTAGTRALRDLLRPGGRLVVTVWERGAIAPAPEVLRRAVLAERPDLSLPFAQDPLRGVDQPGSFATWLAGLGLEHVRVERSPLRVRDAAVPLGDAEVGALWLLVVGSALRRFLHGLDAEAVERVRERFTAEMTAAGGAVDATTLIGVGTVPE
ncbi:class I SAM-dependent methyltransferase [Allostreptomyces psammosilenae]|uniref:Ubiquinone/menaquinone biosynthesis C-methylase UbiE n=1 Tax=Allostreptomyces psammosilenae TaxID=1892865 RepID=A0A852ZQE1_9ACTN|nr:methyltransferase domain-containing protein [Allostreptomyces psammosilenae]NYI03490.1 ubiquinone/menaquinone biosynthesis C-methylase UbiE [Allostreptomyces psammosilenae]